MIGEDAEAINTTHYGFTADKMVNLLKKVTPVCKEYLFNCRWNGKWTACEDLFRVVSTDDGYCCTFNSAPAKLKLSNVGSASGSSNADQEYEEEYYEDDFDDEYYDEDYDYDSSGPCPNDNPLAATTEESNDIWDELCTKYWDTKNSATTAAPSESTTKKKEKKKVVVRKALGAGLNLGLRFEVDILNCAYLRQNFEGFMVWIYYL